MIDIRSVGDLDGDGAVGMSDVEHLLKNDANAAAPLVGDGDFRSTECAELLQQSDIVVTNPPFSLFRAYLDSPYGAQQAVLDSGRSERYHL